MIKKKKTSSSTKASKAKKVSTVKRSPKVKKVSAKREDSEILAELAIKGIQEKSGRDVMSFDLRNVKNTVTDFFIICHAESSTQVNAIANSVEEVIQKERGEKPWHSEGFGNAEWILLDYSSVVVHVFREDRRYFYNLEKLWADADVQKIA